MKAGPIGIITMLLPTFDHYFLTALANQLERETRHKDKAVVRRRKRKAVKS